MTELKVRTYRTAKHEGLALWNGKQKIKFIRGAFSTSDADTISFLKKKIKSAPHFCIKEIKPGDEVVVITKDDQQQAAVERQDLQNEIADLKAKLGNTERVIDPVKQPASLAPGKTVDNRTPQQKAADTRKANKEAQEKK